ncbi:MAG: glycosyltransferase family 4 protein, partial [Candidatus Helarchaeota archaeon]
AEVFERLGVPQQALLVVAAGRLSPEKGHRYLVEAVAKTQPLERDVCYLFCGEGQCMAELQAQSRDLGIMHRCIFPGFRRDLQDIFKVMDLLVLPSLTEGLPNVVLEAFALAKPVIATKVGGVPEVIDNGKNGILVPPKRPDLLAEAINKCLFAPEISRQMGEVGYRKVKSEFTFETQTKRLESVYHELLNCA